MTKLNKHTLSVMMDAIEYIQDEYMSDHLNDFFYANDIALSDEDHEEACWQMRKALNNAYHYLDEIE